jgi:hypothetical protein
MTVWRNLDNQRPDSAHYSIMALANPNTGMAALRAMFPEGEANDLNFVLFSTSGVHGTYCLIEEVEEHFDRQDDEGPKDVTFVIVHPRLVALRYGVCEPETPDDIAFLKKLRASSSKAAGAIGWPT